MRTFKSSSLNNFQLYNTVLWTTVIVTMLCVTSLWYIPYKWKCVPFDPLHPFSPPHPPTNGNYQSVVCIYELRFFFFKDSTYNNKVLLWSTGSNIQYSVIIYHRKRTWESCKCVTGSLSVYQKLTQNCESTILQVLKTPHISEIIRHLSLSDILPLAKFLQV